MCSTPCEDPGSYLDGQDRSSIGSVNCVKSKLVSEALFNSLLLILVQVVTRWPLTAQLE